MAIIIKSPSPLKEGFSVFLAGSIEMGSAGNWQATVEEKLSDTNIVIFNPRRDNWDPSWVQSKDAPHFHEQVKWELNAMEKANVIAMYFEPNTKSPVTLMELGLHARSGKMIVCCPDGFWRRGNVDIVCEKYGVEQVETLNDLLERIIQIAGENGAA